MMTTPTILVVDDSSTSLEFVKGILESEGFQTVAATDGPAARRIATASQPDLILLDVAMPDEDGFETCSRLKSAPSTANIPIIFLSALDDVESKVMGLKIGAVDYISKPVHRDEVLARVRVHLRIRQDNRAAVETQRARLEQLRDAQQAILIRPEECPNARFAVYYQPLEEAGGDFYDVMPTGPESFGYFVGDLSGHGVSAAFLTSAIKALLRHYSGPLFTPEDTLRGVDAVMHQMLGSEQYLTACYARLNRSTRRLTVISAGHPPVVLIKQDGQAQILDMDSGPLGIFSNLVLQRRDVRVSKGDRLFLYTDGLIESAPGYGRKAGMTRLLETCVQYRSAPLEDLPRTIAGEIVSGAAPQDDVLLMAIEAA